MANPWPPKQLTRRFRDAQEFEEFLASGSPHHAEAERAILGAIILDNAVMDNALENGIHTDVFYTKAHAYTWDAIVTLHNEGKEINPILIGHVLAREGLVERVGGIAFLSELTYGLPHFTNVAAYAKVVLDKYALRETLKTERMNEALILSEEMEAHEILAQVEHNVLEVIDRVTRGGRGRGREFVDVGQDEQEFAALLQRRHEGIADGLETPIKWLNDKLEGGGLQPQGLYLIAAPPKVGKTSFLLWLADHWATQLGQPGGILTMEMRRIALETRLFAQYTGVPFWMLQRKGLHGTPWEVARKSIKPFFEALRRRLFIVDSIHTLTQFRHAARRLVLGPTKAKWLATDYVQLMSATENPDPYQRAAEIGHVSRGLKLVAQELNVPLIAISSLNQESEREGRRPELTDLAWTGNLRYDAEAIMFMHNRDYKKAMTREQRMAFDAMRVWHVSLILAAQRNGPTGETELDFVKEFMQFNESETADPVTQDVQFEAPSLPPLELDEEAMWANNGKGGGEEWLA